MFFHLGKRFKVFWLLKGKPGYSRRGKRKTKGNSVVIHSFNKCLLSVCYVPGTVHNC